MKSATVRSERPGPRASAPKPAVRKVRIDEDEAGQRIDNYLLRVLKGVPRTHVYRLLRGGEVRVNGGRIDATYRLASGDEVRIPPVRMAAPKKGDPSVKPAPDFEVVYEDDHLLVINKPSGVAVHGGSGVSFGVIEQLRAADPQRRFLELVHRLDRETSGLLMLAKKRSALRRVQDAIRERAVHKAYLTLVAGDWGPASKEVELPLRKYLTEAGERRVAVHRDGQASRTVFEPVERVGPYSLLRAILDTGRTHQLRVQLAHLGFPIVGDDKYGDFELNRRLAKQGLKRMFLHAAELAFEHPATQERISLAAPLPPSLQTPLDMLKARGAESL